MGGRGLVSEFLWGVVDEGNIGGGIFWRKKPIDTAKHNFILSKLERHYNLWNGKQYISINSYDSSLATVKFSICQGWALGPPLFLTYNNEL